MRDDGEDGYWNEGNTADSDGVEAAIRGLSDNAGPGIASRKTAAAIIHDDAPAWRSIMGAIDQARNQRSKSSAHTQQHTSAKIVPIQANDEVIPSGPIRSTGDSFSGTPGALKGGTDGNHRASPRHESMTNSNNSIGMEGNGSVNGRPPPKHALHSMHKRRRA